MLRTIFWYSYFALSLLPTIPKVKKARKLKESGNAREFEDYAFGIVADWAEKQVRNSGSQMIIHGMENIPKDAAVLFVSNHQSNFDIPIFLCKLNVHAGLMAKTELKKLPVISTWMELIDCVFMDRNDMRQSLESIMRGIDLLKSGRSMVVFPEGTRSKGDKMGEFKPGSLKLATKSGAPIVPVTIDGSYKVMEFNRNFIKPAVINIYIHTPIETKSLTKEQSRTLLEDIKKIIEKPLILN